MQSRMFLHPPHRARPAARGPLWVLAWLAFAPVAQAHDPGLSALTVTVQPVTLTATLSLARADVETLVPLDANRDGHVTATEFEAARSALEKLAAQALEIAFDGSPAPVLQTRLELDPSDAVHFQFTFTRDPALELRVRSTLLERLPRGHRQYLSLRDAAGRTLGEKLLDAGNPSFVTKLPDADAPTHPPTFLGFLMLGVHHIATGYDHLVFLLGLLIVGAGFRDVFKIITSFTLAHSFTLALATLGYLRLSSSVVEPLIAASIMYVGLENIFHRNLQHRWMLTFFFGLVHGCGFASALQQSGIGGNSGGIVWPLLSFNLGVELGQLTLAAMVLPLIWRWQKRPRYVARYVPAMSLLIALAGAGWLVERLLPLLRG